MTEYDYLKERIKGDVWLGKEILGIVESVQDAINGGREWLLELPPIKFIMSNPACSFLADILTASKDLTYTVTSVGLIFLESVYGINKALNSERHKDLAGAGNFMLSALRPTGAENSRYKSVLAAYNENLNIPLLSKELSEKKVSIPGFGGSHVPFMEEKQIDWLQKLNDAKDSLLAQIASLAGAAKTKAKRLLTQIEAAIKQTSGQSTTEPRGINTTNLNARSKAIIVAAPIVPVVTGTAAATMGVVGAIAGWLLQSFLLTNVSGAPLSAIIQATTSIVMKFIGSAGAIASRYFAASSIKALIKSLPQIVARTGMSAVAWTFLMAYAVPIIVAAIITAEAIRNKTMLGELLYVFGLTKTQITPDSTFAVLANTNRLEMSNEMLRIGKKMIGNSGKEYSVLMGIAVNRKDEKPVLCLDMSKIDLPVRIAQKDAIAIAAQPFRHITHDPEGRPPFLI